MFHFRFKMLEPGTSAVTLDEPTYDRPCILIVDDDGEIRATIAEYLEAQDYRILQAGDARMARELVESDSVDLVILDLKLPGEDGLSLCRHLRETTDLAIIMLTGAGDALDRIIGLEVGADDYIAKPFELREVLARIRSILRRETRRQPKPGDGDDPASFSTDELNRIKSYISGSSGSADANRILLTVLFTDIVDSTRLAAHLGDQQWSRLLDRHNQIVRQCIADAGGVEIKTLGDGFMAAFDTPGRSLQCAVAARTGMLPIDVRIRAGVHTGECELKGNDIAGVAVHLAARVIGLAEPGEILVSNTVKELMTGSAIRFEDRGVHTLKGIPDQWRVFSLREAPDASE